MYPQSALHLIVCDLKIIQSYKKIFQNDAIVLNQIKNRNLDCWVQYPLGLFALCDDDASTWGRDVLAIAKNLSAGLQVETENSVTLTGTFVPIPSDFTVQISVQ